jgi:hypothetical protein
MHAGQTAKELTTMNMDPHVSKLLLLQIIGYEYGSSCKYFFLIQIITVLNLILYLQCFPYAESYCGMCLGL